MERFWQRVSITDYCWNWKGTLNNGYGLFSYGKKRIAAHRFIFLAMNDLILPGLQIDHLCRNKACVNPEHLELVTPAENVKRAVPFRKYYVPSMLRTHCRAGHKYTKSNSMLLNTGGKICKKCNEMSEELSK